jgi:hypothetical protein
MLTEFRAIDPKAMKQNGKLSCYRNDCAAAAFGTHQSHSP